MKRKIKIVNICNNNELIQYLTNSKLNKNKYSLQNLNGKYLNFNLNNLQDGLFYNDNKRIFNFKIIDNYYLITTDTLPKFYLNTDLKGNLSLVVDSNLKGNKWCFRKLNNEGLLKSLVRKDSSNITNNTIKNIKKKYGRIPNNISESNLKYTLDKKVQDSINNNKVQNHLISKNLQLVYDKNKFIYNNGYYIQSFYYGYYLSKNRCLICPKLEDIIIFT